MAFCFPKKVSGVRVILHANHRHMKLIAFTAEEKELLFEHLSFFLREYEEVNYPLDSSRITKRRDTPDMKRIRSMLDRLSSNRDRGLPLLKGEYSAVVLATITVNFASKSHPIALYSG